MVLGTNSSYGQLSSKRIPRSENGYRLVEDVESLRGKAQRLGFELHEVEADGSHFFYALGISKNVADELERSGTKVRPLSASDIRRVNELEKRPKSEGPSYVLGIEGA